MGGIGADGVVVAEDFLAQLAAQVGALLVGGLGFESAPDGVQQQLAGRRGAEDHVVLAGCERLGVLGLLRDGQRPAGDLRRLYGRGVVADCFGPAGTRGAQHRRVQVGVGLGMVGPQAGGIGDGLEGRPVGIGARETQVLGLDGLRGGGELLGLGQRAETRGALAIRVDRRVLARFGGFNRRHVFGIGRGDLGDGLGALDRGSKGIGAEIFGGSRAVALPVSAFDIQAGARAADVLSDDVVREPRCGRDASGKAGDRGFRAGELEDLFEEFESL